MAALREAEEEVGLERNFVEVLGTLSPHFTVTGFEVTPVLALIRGFLLPEARGGRGRGGVLRSLRACNRSDPLPYRIAALAGRQAALLRCAMGALLHLGGDGANAPGARGQASAMRLTGDWLTRSADPAEYSMRSKIPDTASTTSAVSCGMQRLVCP